MYKLKNIDTFINEAKLPEGAITPAQIKSAVSITAIQKKKYVSNLKDKGWRIAIKPIEVKQKDIEANAVAITGKYLITGFYKSMGEYKVEFAACTEKSGAGSFARTIDEKKWRKLVDKYSSSLLDPNKLTKGDLDTLANVTTKFLEKEANDINKNIKPKEKGKLDINDLKSLGKELEGSYKGSEFYILNDNKRIRFNMFIKKAGDGRAVPPTNLWFIIEPAMKSAEFKDPNGILSKSFNYKDFKDLLSNIRDNVNDWKKRDKDNYEEGRYNAWKLDR